MQLSVPLMRVGATERPVALECVAWKMPTAPCIHRAAARAHPRRMTLAFCGSSSCAPTHAVAQPGAPCVTAATCAVLLHGLASCMSHDALARVTVVCGSSSPSRMHVVVSTNAHAVAKSAEPITFSDRYLPYTALGVTSLSRRAVAGLTRCSRCPVCGAVRTNRRYGQSTDKRHP